LSNQLWESVDRYLGGIAGVTDPALTAALAASDAAGLPSINVSPTHGKLLHLIARMIGARRILEVGTLGGYSAIWLARALPPDGQLVTIEIDPKHAAVARESIARAGLTHLVDLRIGKALDVLPQLEGPFDLTFIDADKPSNTEYFQWALKLSRPGGVIVVDNVVRRGAVIEPDSADAQVQGVRRFLDALAAESRVDATALQTVGLKGYDGFVLARVKE
jgi:predicted O-methyltransferase YrrM